MTDWHNFERYVAINEARYPGDRRYTIRVTGTSNGRDEEILSVDPPSFRVELGEQEAVRLLDCYWKTRELLTPDSRGRTFSATTDPLRADRGASSS